MTVSTLGPAERTAASRGQPLVLFHPHLTKCETRFKPMQPSWRRGCEQGSLFLAQPPFDRLPRAKEEKLVKASTSVA